MAMLNNQRNPWLQGAQAMERFDLDPGVLLQGCGEVAGEDPILERTDHKHETPTVSQWIGLRENLQETSDFPIKYGAFL